ncbi:hypothetical protein GO755_11680 [Spirosoma sp. HMF4905]|uniref:Fibronectin type-III domain-containing protein n=1 Tax=Spirosoma arboris TaxID=2682092 RepID=A0A7K1SA26_9BACT|nr:fibronectin type III domain-containing protein [Spirosoma arboris]MVM30693.1 hypothetical protein [Spirosoma arboris]
MKTFVYTAFISLLIRLTISSALAQTNVPGNLTGSAASYNQVNLSWKDNSSNETKFEIERKDFATFVKVGEAGANVTTYQDKTVAENSTYTYRVRAVFVTSSSGYSNEFTISTPLSPPGEPTNLVAVGQAFSGIKLTWNNGSGSTPVDYTVERGTSSGGPFTVVQTVSYSRAPTFTDNSILAATQYCYRVRSRNTGGTSGYSNVACASIPLAPTNIKNFQATALGTSSIKLTWTGFGKENGIGIERRTGQSGNWSLIASTLSDGGEYTDNGLSSGTEYCYRIAENGHEYSSVVCATTQQSAPNAPARLTATAISSSQINLQWADVSNNETGFQVERASSATAPFTKIADLGANATTYSDQSLQASTQYCYRVRAVNGAGASGYSDIQCATTQAPPVGAPQNLVATAASTTQINLTWTGLSGATTYQLERSLNGNDGWTKIADPAGNATSYNDAGLTPNTRYYYRLLAVVGGNSGPYSNVANAITPDTPPTAPARLTATVISYNQINLQWADLSGNEASFELERSTDGTNFTKIADVGANATSYSDQSLSPQTHYYYRVRAKNAAGPSPYSNTADATTPVGPPGAPQNLVATATSTTQINLTWTAVATATNVLIERSANGTDGWTQIASVAGDATTYSDPNLTQNTRYYYRIRGTNASGTGPYSNIANAITPDVPPVAPARLTATAISATQIDLAWADLSANEASFDIERSSDGTNWTKIGDAPANATSFQNTGLTPNTKYYYRIRAVNAAGPSPYSNTADATTPDVPPVAPANLAATPASATQINLTWADQSANETGFEVERGTSQTGTFTKIADLPANTTTYQDQGLIPAANYCYRLRAKNTIGTSGYSNVVCVATPDIPPAAPARLTATAVSTSQINLAWADLSNNESGFEIERGNSTTGTFTKIADAPANTTTYEDKNLTDNTQYCYRVRAKNAAGNSAYTDATCATTPLAPPATPTNLAAQVFDYDQIKLTWAALGATAVTVIIERATNPNGPFTEIKQIPASQTTYVDMGLQEFTTYYYRIKAINTAGSSGYSNVATARVEEVIIAVEDELETHTTLFVSQRTLHVITNWFTTAQTTVHLQTTNGGIVLTDNRKVRPADCWDYNLDALPTGLYIITIVADGRKLAKRILLP